jgi:hypothetical protein
VKARNERSVTLSEEGETGDEGSERDGGRRTMGMQMRILIL